MDFFPEAPHITAAYEQLLRIGQLPRGERPEAYLSWLETYHTTAEEEWNTEFSPESLFAGWTSSDLMSGLYASNADLIAKHLSSRQGWRAVEVGGGDGRLWREARLQTLGAGHLVVIDPVADTHHQVAKNTPAEVEVSGLTKRVEDAQVPSCDVIICSLTLHHLAGRDREEREAHGLTGIGKREVLEGFRHALSEQNGLLILNEADIHCDLEVPSASPLLRDRLLDSYVRRAAASLLRSITHTSHPVSLRRTWWEIVCSWCVGQLKMAEVPVADRDVYELDVPRWLNVLHDAGFQVVERQFTDPDLLFHQYVCRPR